MEQISYCTRESVQDALGYADNPRLNRRVDSAIRAATAEVEGFLHRVFLPRLATRSFDMPDTDILWLYDSELAGVPTGFTSGGTDMAEGTDYFLRPRSGPPFRWIEERTAGSVKFQADETFQDSIAITGDFSYPCRVLAAGALVGGINSTVTSLILDESSTWGAGSLLRIGSEMLLVTASLMSPTGTTITAGVGAGKGETTLSVADSSLVQTGETIQVDSETMVVTSITGSNLTVQRAARGSVLAAHITSAAVYAPRIARVERGVRGSAAASHSTDADVGVLRPVSLVEELAQALASDILVQSSGGWARPQGASDSERPAYGAGLDALREKAYTAYGRKVRTRAVM